MTSPDTADQPAEGAPRFGRAGEYVDTRVAELQRGYLNPNYRDPAAVAALARLRRGVGKPPGEVIDLLEFTTLPGAFHADEASPPEYDEWAVHVAMTLFAVHQQSRGERMHQRGRGLGGALRSLHQGDPKSLPDPLVRRFRMLGTADNFAELTHHLRGAVQLLRTGSAPLDYGVLTDQLVAWQRGDRSRIQLTWGRQFYRTRRPAPAS